MKEDLHIRVPEWGAGTTYHWDKEYGLRGIGIAKFRVKPLMTIKIQEDTYTIEKRLIDEFMKQYPSSQHTAKGVSLIVIPVSIMTLVKEGPKKPWVSKIPPKPPVPEDPQQKLF